MVDRVKIKRLSLTDNQMQEMFFFKIPIFPVSPCIINVRQYYIGHKNPSTLKKKKTMLKILNHIIKTSKLIPLLLTLSETHRNIPCNNKLCPHTSAGAVPLARHAGSSWWANWLHTTPTEPRVAV